VVSRDRERKERKARAQTSEPARSTRVNFPVVTDPVLRFVNVTTRLQIKCERELSAFICVEAVVLREAPAEEDREGDERQDKDHVVEDHTKLENIHDISGRLCHHGIRTIHLHKTRGRMLSEGNL
jgi:hypothetical protein